MSTATDYDKQQDEITKAIDERLKKVEARDPGPEPLCELGYHWSVEQGKCVPDTPVPEKCVNPDPTGEHVKEGGWGGDMTTPKAWQSVAMKDDPNLWKVVDKNDVNIAHKFTTEQEADKYIAYYICLQEAGGPDEPKPCPPNMYRDPTTGECVETPPPPPPPTGGAETPYEIVGTPMDSTQRGPTTRHYASGKADDETIEKNVKGIKFDNYQWVCYVTMHKIEHEDAVSVKFGGIHQGANGWFDCGISFGEAGKKGGDGQCCLGTEPDHPSTNLCVKKGPTIGNILEKKLGIAGVYYKKQNKIELWSKLDGGAWTKQLEGVDVDGLKPNSAINEAQLRIDGFAKGSIPTIEYAKVSEIKV